MVFRSILAASLSFIAFVFLLAALWRPAPTTSTPASAVAQAEIEQAVQACGKHLGYGPSTVMTKEKVELMTLCMLPTMQRLQRTH